MRTHHPLIAITLLTLVTSSGGDLSHIPNAPASVPDSVTAHSGRRTLEGVRNFGEVTPNLYRGGKPTKAGLAALARMGVDIVVDVGSDEHERREATKLGMRYVAIPWHCYHKKDDFFARFLSLVRTNPGKRVFVHCRLGSDRTGMMVAAYRMAEQGWTAEAAKKEMQEFGFTFIHHFMCPGLGAYETSFPQRLQTSPAFQDLRH